MNERSFSFFLFRLSLLALGQGFISSFISSFISFHFSVGHVNASLGTRRPGWSYGVAVFLDWVGLRSELSSCQ